MALDPYTAWFGYEDYVEAATIIPQTPEFDGVNLGTVQNIKDRYTYRAWRSPAFEQWFQVDFGEDKTFQSLCVVFPRITDKKRSDDTQWITPTDPIQHRLDAHGGTAGAGAVFNSGQFANGARSDRGYHLIVFPSPVTARYWRCNIRAAARETTATFRVALALATPVFQPSFNHVFGDRLTWNDASTLNRAPASRVGFPNRLERTLSARLVWDGIPDSEVPSWERLDEWVGLTEPFVFARGGKTPDLKTASTGSDFYLWEPDRCFVANMASGLSLQSRQLDVNIKQLDLEEHR